MIGMPKTNITTFERCVIKSCIWPFEHPKIFFGVIFLMIIFVLAAGARATCNTIPERQDLVCQQLGYDSYPCPIKWETNGRGFPKGVVGRLTLISDDNADEPLTGSDVQTKVTLMKFKTTVVELDKIFTVSGPSYYPFLKTPSDPPCVTPKCTMKQIIEGLEYRGIEEKELLDVANIIYRAVWQAPDARMADKLREAYHATGIPIIVWAGDAVLKDESETELASRLELNVLWFFVLPGD